MPTDDSKSSPDNRKYNSRSTSGSGGQRRDDQRGQRRSFGDRDDQRGQRRSFGDRDDQRGQRRSFGDRDDQRGQRRSFGDRDDQRGQRRSFDDRDGRRTGRGYGEDREEKIHRPGTAPRADEPETPQDYVENELPFGVRAELKGLPKDLADTVGAHIWAAGQLIDVDPDLAFRHAEAARRRAGRLPVVREAAAETAYAAGEYATALREFRAIRRMTGSDELIPVIADCERALGRSREALSVLAELSPSTKDIALRIECLLVEAGIRNDLGEGAEARRLLKAAISRQIGPKFAQARLRYAYASYLEADGDAEGAREWFTSAAGLDLAGDLDISDRIAALDGVVLPESMMLDEGNEDDDEREEAGSADEAGDDEQA